MSTDPLSAPSKLIGTCRGHGHWFPVERVHEACPEPGCEAACDYYELLSDAEMLHRSRAASDSVWCTCASRPNEYRSRSDGLWHCVDCDGLVRLRIPDDGIPPTAIGGVDD